VKPSRTVIFVHIAKTAGVTFRAILRREYGRPAIYTIDDEDPAASVGKLARLTPSERVTIRLVEGHWPVGLHRDLPGARYITLLRDPVARVISHYRHVLRTPWHYVYRNGFSPRMTLHEYVTSDVAGVEVENCQTWMLSGGSETDLGASDRRRLEIVAANLQHFALVGLTEMFDPTLMILARALGWIRTQFYHAENTAPDGPALAQVSRDTIEVVRERNQLDLTLYELAAAELRARLARQSPADRLRLAIFRVRNGLYGECVRSAGSRRPRARAAAAAARLLRALPRE
jgi:hypothetical protein